MTSCCVWAAQMVIQRTDDRTGSCSVEFANAALYSSWTDQSVDLPLDAAAYAGRNGATFLVLSDPDESDTGAAYPILNFPTHIFIDEDGIVRSVILEDMDEEQAIAEASRVLADAAPANS